jgi:hypothetical protein
MMISAKQALEAFQESFVNQNSAPIAELLSDDFVCISSKNETQTKEEMLEWVASFEGRIADFETLYENDEVLVGTQSPLSFPQNLQPTQASPLLFEFHFYYLYKQNRQITIQQSELSFDSQKILEKLQVLVLLKSS